MKPRAIYDAAPLPQVPGTPGYNPVEAMLEPTQPSAPYLELPALYPAPVATLQPVAASAQTTERPSAHRVLREDVPGDTAPFPQEPGTPGYNPVVAALARQTEELERPQEHIDAAAAVAALARQVEELGRLQEHIEAIVQDLPPDVVIEIVQDPAQIQQQPDDSSKLFIVLLPIPVINALDEATEIALGMKEHPQALAGTVAGISFVVEVLVDAKFTIEGINDFIDIIRKRQFPENWVKLSTGRNAAAITLSVIISAWAAFADSIMAYYFVLELPERYAFLDALGPTGLSIMAGIIAAFSGIGVASSEGPETLKEIRNRLAGKEHKYSNRFSKFVSPVLGSVTGIFSSLNDWAASIIGMKSIFKISDPVGLGVLSAFCGLSGVSDYSMNARINVKACDSFFGAFTSGAYKNPYKVVSLVTSIGVGGLLAYAWQGLAKNLLTQVGEVWGVNPAISGPFVEVIACGSGSAYFLRSASSLYPVVLKAAEKVGSKIAGCCCGSCSCCKADPLENNDDLMEDDDSPVAQPLNLDDDSDDGHAAEAHYAPLPQAAQPATDNDANPAADTDAAPAATLLSFNDLAGSDSEPEKSELLENSFFSHGKSKQQYPSNNARPEPHH